MPYCTQADIENLELTQQELVQLTDDNNTGIVDPAKITAAILKADAEIDANCQARYTVPFSSVPPIVLGWSATLAAFNLHRNRKKPETLIDRYNKVMSWLKSIREGDASIAGVADEGSLPRSTTMGVLPTFSRAQMNAPAVVIGTNGKTYTCIAQHTAASDNMPVSGANWQSYWIEQGSNGTVWATGQTYRPAGVLVLDPGTVEIW